MTGFLILFTSASTVSAKTFGAVELGSAYNSNFNASTSSADAISEKVNLLSASLGMYTPLSKQSMLILKGGVRHSQFDTADYLDGNIFNASAGVYFRFSKRNSLTSTLGTRLKRFYDSRRDGEIFNIGLRFKQKISSTFWFQEGLLAEKGKAESTSGEYKGYALNASLNWKLDKKYKISLSAGSVNRVYETTLGRKRQGQHVFLGTTYLMSKKWYIRGGVGRQLNNNGNGKDYRNTNLAVALGYTF